MVSIELVREGFVDDLIRVNSSAIFCGSEGIGGKFGK